MNSEIKTFIVDSFTNEAFKGNPAGVCVAEEALAPALMQRIAAELNLSETAFLVHDIPNDRYLIRYFSPQMEIPLCGHATLASAKVLLETGDLNRILFRTGEPLELPVRKDGDWIEMKFPVYGLQETAAPEALLKALGIKTIQFCGFNQETKILILEIGRCDDLALLRPDFHALLRSHDSINGVLVTARADDGFDFHSRYFWPWSGTNEDPVTGGTHTFLAKYWSDKLGKRTMRSFQASERTGQMEVELVDDGTLLIRGSAVVVLEGKIRV
jgi:PhzF family phenazine biosynthesis protein